MTDEITNKNNETLKGRISNDLDYYREATAMAVELSYNNSGDIEENKKNEENEENKLKKITEKIKESIPIFRAYERHRQRKKEEEQEKYKTTLDELKSEGYTPLFSGWDYSDRTNTDIKSRKNKNAKDINDGYVINSKTGFAATVFKNYKKILTGHSLGGSLAMALGAITGEETYAYNPLGISNMVNSIKDKTGMYIDPNKDYENIYNFSTEKDILYKLANKKPNIHNLGKTYIISEKNGLKHLIQKILFGIKSHNDFVLLKKGKFTSSNDKFKTRTNIINRMAKRINNIFHPTSSKDIFKGFRAAIEDENISEAQRQKLIEEKIKQIKEENKKRIKTKVNPLTKEQKKEYEKMKKILSTMKDGFLLTEYGHLITITYEQYHERYMNHLVKKLKETAKNRITKQRENKRRYVAF